MTTLALVLFPLALIAAVTTAYWFGRLSRAPRPAAPPVVVENITQTRMVEAITTGAIMLEVGHLPVDLPLLPPTDEP